LGRSLGDADVELMRCATADENLRDLISKR